MKYVLFGAGYFGKEAIKEYGKENIICFWDNDATKHGKTLDGIAIVEFSKKEDIDEEYNVILCTIYYGDVIEQLKSEGISNYEIFHSIIVRNSYYSPKILIDNPYENSCDRDLSEPEWIEKNNGKLKYGAINRKVEQLYRERHMFHHIEIETVNRCNGICSFCPVSKGNEHRPYALMDEKVFRKIIDELSEMNYDGRLALFSNNEPLLDDRIVEFHRYARKKLPNARMHLYSNGTLMTREIFEELIMYLVSALFTGSLIPASRMVKEYAEIHPEIVKKVTIVLRKPNEILTSRGGDAPNRTQIHIENNISCVQPFQQLIIRPDGKVSLCCNDPLGRETMGNVTENSLDEIWYGEAFENVRKRIFYGRENFEHCKNCDVFVLD